MTRHNDEPTTSSIEPDSIQTVSNRQSSSKPLKTCKTSKFFQWVIFFLTFLLTTSLLFIGVSFSKNISSGEVSNVSLTLTAANFDIDASGYYGSESEEDFYYDEDKNQILVYSFTITNNSNLDANGTVVFNDMEICFENGTERPNPNPLYGITLILFGVNDESDESDGGVSLFVFTRNEHLDTPYTIATETVDPVTKKNVPYTYTFSLSKTDDGELSSKTYLLVLDCSSCGDNGGDTATVTLSGTIDITVNQTNQVVEEE